MHVHRACIAVRDPVAGKPIGPSRTRKDSSDVHPFPVRERSVRARTRRGDRRARRRSRPRRRRHGRTIRLRRHEQAGHVPQGDRRHGSTLSAAVLRIPAGHVLPLAHAVERAGPRRDRRRVPAAARRGQLEGQPLGAAPGAARPLRPARARAHGRHAHEQRPRQRPAPLARGRGPDRAHRDGARTFVRGLRLRRDRRRHQHHHPPAAARVVVLHAARRDRRGVLRRLQRRPALRRTGRGAPARGEAVRAGLGRLAQRQGLHGADRQGPQLGLRRLERARGRELRVLAGPAPQLGLPALPRQRHRHPRTVVRVPGRFAGLRVPLLRP